VSRASLLPGPQVTALRTEVLSRRVGAAGLCADLNDDRWFPPRDPRSEKRRQKFAELARAACLGCTVMAECRELALRIEAHPHVAAHGIWGGLAPWERDELRALRREHMARLREFIAALARSYGLAAAFGEYSGYGPDSWYAVIATGDGAAVLTFDSRIEVWKNAVGAEISGGQVEEHLQRATTAPRPAGAAKGCPPTAGGRS
jgi:Transcription factor WhiB